MIGYSISRALRLLVERSFRPLSKEAREIAVGLAEDRISLPIDDSGVDHNEIRIDADHVVVLRLNR